MYDGVICVGSIVAAFLWHASASLCGDSLANVAVVSWRKVRNQRAQWQTAFGDALQRKQPRHRSKRLRWRGACCYVRYSLRFSLFEVECREVGGVGYYRAWQFVVAHACELVACTTEQVQFCYLCALECHIVNVYCKVLKLHCGVGFRCCC